MDATPEQAITAATIAHPIPKLIRLPIFHGIEALRKSGKPVDPQVNLLDDFIRTPAGDDRVDAREFLALSQQVREQAAVLKAVQLPELISGKPEVAPMLTDFYIEKLKVAEGDAVRAIRNEEALVTRAQLLDSVQQAESAGSVTPEAAQLMREAMATGAFMEMLNNHHLPSDKQPPIFHVTGSVAETARGGAAYDRIELKEGMANYLRQYFPSESAGNIAGAVVQAVVEARQAQLNTLPRSAGGVRSIG